MEKTYNQYLFPQVLNEMYYGKHNKFKEIENYFDELRELLKNHDELLKQVNKHLRTEKWAEYSDNKNKTKYKAHKLGNQFHKFREDATEEQFNTMCSYIVDQLENGYLNNDIKTMEEFYDKKINALEEIREKNDRYATDIKTGEFNDRSIRIPWYYKNKNVDKNDDEMIRRFGEKETTGFMITDPLQFLRTNLFTPINRQEAKDYDRIINKIGDSLDSIFNFPGNIRLIIICNSILPNGAYVSNTPDSEIARQDRIIRRRKNSPLFKNLIDSGRLNKVSSDNDKLYYTRTKNSVPGIISLSDVLIKDFPSDLIMALLLHEVGHDFAYRILPIDICLNRLIQERFADAFATKFGYGLELIKALKKMNIACIGANKNFIKVANMDLNSQERGIEFAQGIAYDAQLKKYEFRRDENIYDPHPTNIHRYEEILHHLEIELDNPNVSEIKKRKLKKEIEDVKKEIPSYGNDLNNVWMMSTDKILYKSKMANFEMEKSNPYSDAKAIRDMLDKIYNRSMKK